GSIGTGSGPSDVVTVAEKGRIYVSNSDEDSVSIIDLNSIKEIKKIKLQKHSHPTDLVLSSQRDKLFVNDSLQKSISVIDLKNDELEKPDIIVSGITNAERIFGNNGGLVLLGGNQLGIMPGGSNNIGPIHQVSSNNSSKAVISENGLFLVSGSDIINFNLNSGTETRFAAPSQPVAIALNQFGSVLYSASSDSLSILGPTNGSPLQTNIPTGQTHISKLILSPSGDKLFILSSD